MRWRAEHLDAPRPMSRPLFDSRRSALRQFAGGALAAFAVAGAGYLLAPHDHPQTRTTTTQPR